MKYIVLVLSVLVLMSCGRMTYDEVDLSKDEITAIRQIDSLAGGLYTLKAKIQLDNVIYDNKAMALHQFMDIDINENYIAAIPEFGIVYLWGKDGHYITNIGAKGRSAGMYRYAAGVSFDGPDIVWVYDSQQKQMLKYKIDGKSVTHLETHDVATDLPGPLVKFYGKAGDDYFFYSPKEKDCDMVLMADDRMHFHMSFKHAETDKALGFHNLMVVNKDRVFVSDDYYPGLFNRHVYNLRSGRIEVYDLKGELLRVHKRPYRKPTSLTPVFDKSGSIYYLIQSGKDNANCALYNINGKRVHLFELNGNSTDSIDYFQMQHEEAVQSYDIGSGGYRKVIVTNDADKTKSAVLYVWDFELGPI